MAVQRQVHDKSLNQGGNVRCLATVRVVRHRAVSFGHIIMNRLMILVLAMVFAAATGLVADEQADESKQREAAVRQYLEIKFDEFVESADGDRVVYGLANDPKAELTLVTIKELAQVLPTTTFYCTTLETNHLEYSQLEVIVAVTKAGSKYDVRSCLSPVFQSPSKRFLALIHGKAAQSPDQRKQLVVGMGKLLAAVTYKSQLKNEQVGERRASVELWHHDLHWRNIELCFDENHAVEEVLETPGGKQLAEKQAR